MKLESALLVIALCAIAAAFWYNIVKRATGHKGCSCNKTTSTAMPAVTESPETVL